jgi:hypothetical protein
MAKFIEIRLPLGTKMDEFVTEICWQAWKLAGTQLDAAVSLGIRPETLAKKLKLHRPLNQLSVKAGSGRT